MTASQTAVQLFGPEGRVNPYPFYQRLRDEAPLFWSEELNAWLVTRYDEVAAGLQDLRLSSDRAPLFRRLAARPELDPLFDFMSDRMVLTDLPKHARLRTLVNKAFTPHVIEALRPHIQQLVDGFVTAGVRAGQMDVVRELAFPLPATVICELLGIPAADRDLLHRWSNAFVVYFSTHPSLITPAQYDAALDSVRQTVDYFEKMLPKLSGANSLLKLMLGAEEQGSKLSHAEVIANAQLFFVAGHETTTNLIGNGVFDLLRYPEQLAKLRANPELMPGAVEEFLRFDGPVQFTHRIAKEEVKLGDQTLAPGQFVFLFLAAANHDPAHFPEPERFDVARTNNKHLSFGMGHHYCLGAPLARLECNIVFETLLRLAPKMRLTTDRWEYNDNFNLRGLKSLPIAFN